MQVEFANEHEGRLCRALVALRGTADAYVSPNEVPMAPAVCGGLERRGWIRGDKGHYPQRWQLTESGQRMAALVASLLKV